MPKNHSLDIPLIQAVTLDLDDTLWPVWPAIERAEAVLHEFLQQHAPATAQLFGDAKALRLIRNQVGEEMPELQHDLSELRRESIRRALRQAGDDPTLAEAGFDLFFAERQRVDFYADAIDSLERMAARWPLVALSNGNADIHTVGIGHLFKAKIGAREFGRAKPDAHIFHAAAALAEVPSQTVLHVGDDAALDIVGALGAGMQAAWVNRTGHAWALGQPPHIEVTELGTLCEALGC
ncbi:HAD-IA family hydrolase [Xylophilus rhododendri]|uniref:HAD-IA family hydrolase n=1 Tax=Xylophilus rhododendri TaxID=2697032 RepID=A0A857IZB6_9BURK|nr:HAD-IA family hydrolase [Xylophilus rhododendri]QHI96647.1 HAD-IA family hydrolase [Xylophilus rhododendri]